MTITPPEAHRPASHFKQPERGQSVRDPGHDFSGILSGREALASIVSETDIASDDTAAHEFSDLAFFQQSAVPESLAFERMAESPAAEVVHVFEGNAGSAQQPAAPEDFQGLQVARSDQLDHLSGLRFVPRQSLAAVNESIPSGKTGSAGPAISQAPGPQPAIRANTVAAIKIEASQLSAAQRTATARTDARSLSALSLCLKLEDEQASISARVSGLGPEDEAELERRIRDELTQARLGLQDIALNGRKTRILGKE